MPHLISLENFKSRLTKHTFSFVIQDKMKSAETEEIKKELFSQFLQAQKTEALMIFQDAYAGGDAYMKALAEEQTKAMNQIVETAVCRVPSHHLEVKVFNSLSIQLQDFITKLYHHDWYYDYSDDIKVWRAGKAKEEIIGKIMKDGGAEYVYWYDKFKPTSKVN
jgi:hypothetical protein